MTGFWAIFVVGLLKAAMKFAMKLYIAASNTHSYQNIASDKKYAEIRRNTLSKTPIKDSKQKYSLLQEVQIIVKPVINWAPSNSLNTYNRHSDWHKLGSLCYKDVHLFMGFTIKFTFFHFFSNNAQFFSENCVFNYRKYDIQQHLRQ